MKLLYITSLSGRRINGFMRSAITAARKLNINFTMACNMDMADEEGYAEDCANYGIKVEHIDFARNPLSSKNVTAYKQLLALMEKENFDAVHCNTPIGGVLGRICAKKAKIPYVIYQAHGFHFWNGAPLKNWLLYYPVERLLARYTDQLIAINREDYQRAQKFRLKKGGKLTFVHGVGVDTEKFSEQYREGNLREELGLPKDSIIYITVGELIERKNQRAAIQAFAEANIKNSAFLVCGDGELRADLQKFIDDNSVKNVFLLGFRRDVPKLLSNSNVFVFPSFQEGLPGALMEAMAAGLPCIASRIRGNTDLLGEDYKYLFAPNDMLALSRQMQQMVSEQEKYAAICNERVMPFGFHSVLVELETIYANLPKKSV